MSKYLKILLFGFFTWLIPFLVSFPIIQLRATNRAFFETIMAVTVAAVAVVFAILYLRKLRGDFLRAGIVIGVAWFAINLAIDLPLFLLDSPMKMTFPDYMTDIGLTYLIYPIVCAGIGYALERVR